MIEGNDAAAASEFGSREVVTRSVVVGCFGWDSDDLLFQADGRTRAAAAASH
jgi:hypothetical protein